MRSDGAWKDEAKALTDGGVDLVLDPVGGDRFTDSLRSLREEGRAVVVGFTGGSIPEVRVNRLLLNNTEVIGAGWGAYVLSKPDFNLQVGAEVLRLAEEGFVRPVVGARFPLERASEALRLIDGPRCTRQGRARRGAGITRAPQRQPGQRSRICGDRRRVSDGKPSRPEEPPMSPNRTVALLTPVLFAPLAGALSAWVATHFPGVEMPADQVQAVFIAGALIAFGKAAQWLNGWQKYEGREAGSESAALALDDARAEELEARLAALEDAGGATYIDEDVFGPEADFDGLDHEINGEADVLAGR